MRAGVRPLGPAFPFRARLDIVQAWPDGALRHATGRMSGLARVRVDVSGGPALRA